MRNFTGGFYKTAAIADLARKASVIGRGVLQVGKGAVGGLKKSMGDTLGSTLNPLKGLSRGASEISEAAKQRGGYTKMLQSRSGRQIAGQAVGKALPSAAAATGYAYGAKKLYDKTLGSTDNTQGSYYY